MTNSPVLLFTAGATQFDFTSAAANTTAASTGYSLASGAKIGAAIEVNPSITQSGSSKILLGTDGRPSIVTDLSNFGYARQTATLVDYERETILDGETKVEVNWGVYSGGTTVGANGVRSTNFFHFIGAQSTPSAVQASLTGTYTEIEGQSKFITEAGTLGGRLSSASIAITSGRLTSYAIGLSDAQSRSWSANCSNCSGGVPLSTFASSGIALSGTGPGASVTGNAAGFPVGPTGAAVASSFGLKSGDGKAVTGSFIVGK